MLSPSDYNNAVPQFTNGEYASNPINPLYIEEPTAVDYNRGVEPLQTLPAQWWNWLGKQFTSRFNKLNIYVKNIFNELAQLLSLVNITPDGTEQSPTAGQLKTMFQTEYPKYMALLMYPIGSLYWTGKAPSDGGDPNVLFGGSWVQIKGMFVFAKGDSDTLNATGGSKTVTLQTTNLPSHHHTVGEHAHGLNSHTHTINSGNTSSAGTTTTAGIRFVSVSTGAMSGNATGKLTASTRTFPTNYTSSGNISLTAHNGDKNMGGTEGTYNGYDLNINVSHSHSVTASGYIYGKTDAASGSTANSTAFDSENTGDGTAVDKMPPYIVKYCWERTA